MKAVIVCVLAAGALALGACVTTEESAALSADQIKAELVTISQQLDAIQATGRRDEARATAQTRAAAFNAGSTGGFAVSRVYEQSVQGPHERQAVNSARQLGKTERLMRRRDALRAQLSRLTADNLPGRS